MVPEERGEVLQSEQRSTLVSMISHGATLAAVVLAVIAILYLLPRELIQITTGIMFELKLICGFSLLSSALAVIGFWISPDSSGSQLSSRDIVAEVLLHISMMCFIVSIIGLIFIVALLPYPV